MNGRGMLLYFKESITFSQCEVKGIEFEESTMCEIKLNGKDKLLIGFIYRIPNSTDANNSYLHKLMSDIVQGKYTNVVIFGDFNFPDINS